MTAEARTIRLIAFLLLIAVALAAVCVSFRVKAATLHQCPAPRTIDGDTIACGKLHLRLLGIDTADETWSYPCRAHIGNHVCDNALAAKGTASMRALLIAPVTFIPIKKDRYGRTVAEVFTAGRDLQCLQLEADVARYLPNYDSRRRIAKSCPEAAAAAEGPMLNSSYWPSH